jgi:phosphoserine phosphatase
METIKSLGMEGFFEVAAFAHAGMTEDAFIEVARQWLATARHPKLGCLFKELTYLPQIELLRFLRANGFKTFIVSGGGIDLIRTLAEEAYGIPPEQVIGSSVRTRFEIREGRGELVKLAAIDTFDDWNVKAQNIGLHIGRRPIIAFGNSDGDLAMLRYVRTGRGPRMGPASPSRRRGQGIRLRPELPGEPARRRARQGRPVRADGGEHEARLAGHLRGEHAAGCRPRREGRLAGSGGGHDQDHRPAARRWMIGGFP